MSLSEDYIEETDMMIPYTSNISDKLVYTNHPTDIVILDDRMVRKSSDTLAVHPESVMTLEKVGEIHKANGAYMFAGHYYIDQSGNVRGGRPEQALAADLLYLVKHVYGGNPTGSYNMSKMEPTDSGTFTGNKIVIFVSGNTTQEILNKGQRESIINLVHSIMNRWRSIRNVYSLTEYMPSINNFGKMVDMNSLRLDVANSYVPITHNVPAGTSYTYGSRQLYYDSEYPLSGNDISMVQEYLYVLTNFNKNVHRGGLYDKSTLGLVENFQRMYELPVTGEMNKTDYAVLAKAVEKYFQTPTNNKYHRMLKYVEGREMSGLDIQAAQIKLKNLGFLPASYEAKGIYDKTTMDAVTEFQYKNASVTMTNGEIGPTVWKDIMGSQSATYIRNFVYDPTLSDNHQIHGGDVTRIQKAISVLKKKFGITLYTLSGYYDQMTYNNIRKIQQLTGRKVDGIVNEELFNYLVSLV